MKIFRHSKNVQDQKASLQKLCIAWKHIKNENRRFLVNKEQKNNMTATALEPTST